MPVGANQYVLTSRVPLALSNHFLQPGKQVYIPWVFRPEHFTQVPYQLVHFDLLGSIVEAKPPTSDKELFFRTKTGMAGVPFLDILRYQDVMKDSNERFINTSNFTLFRTPVISGYRTTDFQQPISVNHSEWGVLSHYGAALLAVQLYMNFWLVRTIAHLFYQILTCLPLAQWY